MPERQSRAELLGRLLRERGMTLATAESLTGGLLGGRITSVAGSSQYYRGGVVAYATDAKASVLGVDAALLARDGAVSEIVAGSMASRVRALFSASMGVATTGVAGPEDQEGHAPGTLCLGLADSVGTLTTRLRHVSGSREAVRDWAVDSALELLVARLRAGGTARS